MKKAIVIVILLITGFGIYWEHFRNGENSNREIFTEEINRGDITRIVATTGAVRALVTVEVGSQLSGQVLELHADFNSPVKANQLIALIDPQTFEKRVRQAEADVRVAEANVAVQKASITRAEANLRRARLDYERQQPLVEKGTLPETDLDTALANYDSAKAELEMAKAQLRNAQAVVEQRQAGLSSAQIDLERTKIRSPINGVVIERSVDVGQTVAASLSSPVLFKIAQDLRQIQLEANVDEADIGYVKQGNQITFSVDAFPEDEFNGSVNQIRLAPEESQNVVTYTVIISARNPELKLLPGMTANIEITTGKRENVLRVANDALRFRPKHSEESESHGQGPSFFSGSSGRGDGSDQMIMTRLEPLQLDEEKKQQIQQAISESFTEMRDQMFGAGGSRGPGRSFGPPGRGFDRAAMSQRINLMMERVLKQHLTHEQMEIYRKTSNRNIRRGEIWLQDENGEPQRHSVLLGISDDEYTEILNTDIEPGMVVITRIREKKL